MRSNDTLNVAIDPTELKWFAWDVCRDKLDVTVDLWHVPWVVAALSNTLPAEDWQRTVQMCSLARCDSTGICKLLGTQHNVAWSWTATVIYNQNGNQTTTFNDMQVILYWIPGIYFGMLLFTIPAAGNVIFFLHMGPFHRRTTSRARAAAFLVGAPGSAVITYIALARWPAFRDTNFLPNESRANTLGALWATLFMVQNLFAITLISSVCVLQRMPLGPVWIPRDERNMDAAQRVELAEIRAVLAELQARETAFG